MVLRSGFRCPGQWSSLLSGIATFWSVSFAQAISTQDVRVDVEGSRCLARYNHDDLAGQRL